MTRYFGWALHVGGTYGPDATGTVGLSINLVMPGSATVPAWWNPRPDDTWSATTARSELGVLLQPWTWSNITPWQVFVWNPVTRAFDPHGTPSSLSTPTPRASNVTEIQDAADDWLGKVVAGCTCAFSLSPNFTSIPNRSLTHALAPMTHLPAALSGAALGTSGHLEATGLSVGQIAVAFPRVVAQGGTSEWTLASIEVVPDSTGNPQLAVAHYQWDGTGAVPTAQGDTLNVSLVASVALIANSGNTATVSAATVGNDTLSPGDFRALIAKYLHPLAAIRGALQATASTVDKAVLAAQASQFKKIFAWCLGAGDMGVARSVNGTLHRTLFPNWLVADNRIDGARWEAAVDPSKVVANADALLLTWRHALGSGANNSLKDVDAWLATPNSVDAFSAALDAIIAEQANPRTRIWAAWCYALTQTLASQIAAAQDVQSGLQDLLTATTDITFGRTAWLHRLSPLRGNAFWDAQMQTVGPDALDDAAGAVAAAVASDFGITLTFAQALGDGKNDLQSRVSSLSQPEVLRDRGLTVRFVDGAQTPPEADVRGFSVAIQSGRGSDAAHVTPLASAWVTDTAAVFARKGSGLPDWVRDAGGQPAMLPETIGATFEAGQPATSFEYRGAPVVAALSDANSTPAQPTRSSSVDPLFDYRWPPNAPMPPALGHGMWYRSAALLIDNAGGMIGGAVASARTAPDVACAGSPWVRYLSRVRPGAPGLRGLDSKRTALSGQTRLRARWSTLSQVPGSLLKPDKPPLVFLLAGGSDFLAPWTAPMTFQIEPPQADQAFIQAWNVAESATGVAPPAAAGPNPAVKTLRLSLSAVAPDVATVPPVDVPIDGVAALNFTVQRGATWSLTATAATIPPGVCARLSVVSLVDASYVTPGSPSQRFDGFATPIVSGAWEASKAEIWLESTVDPTDVDPSDDWLAIDHAVGEAGAELVTSQAIDATQILGLQFERHEWHWTGYDVRFPRSSDDILSTISTLANVGSYRESARQNLVTDDALMAVTNQVLQSVALPAVRGARMLVYVARPILRFREWLNPVKVAVREAIAIAVSAIVPGQARGVAHDQIPVPAWSNTIPLCETYAEAQATGGDTGYARQANGAMLVFDEPIRRTDQMIRLGGPGETFDVDLVEARDPGGLALSRQELGVNPIFHSLDDTPPALSISVGPSFGLTYDISANPKVTQTAIVLTPVTKPDPNGHRGVMPGRWLMGKVRVRRLYLAELFEDSDLVVASSTSTASSWQLATRVEMPDAIPGDFCVDVVLSAPAGPNAWVSIQLTNSSLPAPLTLRIPALDDEAVQALAAAPPRPVTRRLLVTWHQSRWQGTGDPTWRAQVVLQSPADGVIGWMNLDKVGGELQSDVKLSSSIQMVQVAAVSGAPATMRGRNVLASDYSDARWVTFIGSFGQQLDMPGSYRLKKAADGSLTLQSLAFGTWAPAQWALSPPADPGTGASVFHLLLAYDALKADPLRGNGDPTTGTLCGWFKPDGGNGGKFETFGAQPGTTDVPTHAYLLTFQWRNAFGPGQEAVPTDWSEVLAAMFPPADPLDAMRVMPESTLRLVPEYLGPIRIAT